MYEDAVNLHAAIENKDLSLACKLIREGADVNCCVNRQTACTKAIDVGDKSIINAVLESHLFNPNVGNQFDRTPLYAAAKEGDVELSQRLLSLGAHVDQPDVLGITPLGAAAWYDHVEIADLLIKNGADVNRTCHSGETPLYRACRSSRTLMVRALIRHGCNVNISTNDTHNHPGHTPLMASVSGVNYSVFNSMMDKSISRMVGVMKLLIAKGSNINARDFRGRTALCIAVMDNNCCAVCVLLDADCDVNLTDMFGFSPLHWSLQITQQRHHLAKILTLYGANVDFCLDTSDTKKQDALTMVSEIEKRPLGSREDRAEMISLLVSAMNPYRLESYRNGFPSENPVGDTAQLKESMLDPVLKNRQSTLQSFCRYAIRRSLQCGALKKTDKLPVAKPLKRYINLDYDIHSNHPLRVNELFIAVGESRLDQIRDIVHSGTDVDAPLCDKTPLTLATELGHFEVVTLLLDLGADPGRINRSGETALHLAARNAYVRIARILLDTGVNLESLNSSGRTALLEAAFNGDEETFEILLDAGAEPRACQRDRITALHYMAGNGNKKMVCRLLSMDVDPDAMDSEGARPIHVAATKGRLYTTFLRLPALYRDESRLDHVGVIRALVRHGCDVAARNSRGRSALDMAKSLRSAPDIVHLLTTLNM